MKQSKLTKDQIQKLLLSVVGFIVLLYVYFTFFLGPLNRSRTSMLAKIDELQAKIGSSKSEITKASSLERQAGTATTRFADLQSLTPEGAPIAWFPPRVKTFFANHGIDRATARLESSAPFTEPELAGWIRYNWSIDVPQVDFASLGDSLAALENSEPLLAVTKLSIKASAELPQFQQATIAATATLMKR